MSAVAFAGAVTGVGAKTELAVRSAELPSLSASDRLELSRERLRAAMQPSAPHERHVAATPGVLPHWATSLWSRISSVPAAALVADVLRSWWANHPLRATALVAQDAARSVAAPVAQRNPLALVAGALVLGAVLSRLRPWRWLPRTMLFAGLLPQIASKLLASVPIDSWLNALSSMASSPPVASQRAARRADPA